MATSPSSYFLQSNPLISKRYFPLHLPHPTPTHLRFSKFSPILVTFQPQGNFTKLNVKCFIFLEKKRGHLTSSSLKPNHLSPRRSDDKNPFQITAETILKALNALKMPAITAVLLGLLLMCHPNNPAALAASGGRMGGSSFSSRSSSSSSSRGSSFSSSSSSRRSSFPSYSRSSGGCRGESEVYIDPTFLRWFWRIVFLVLTVSAIAIWLQMASERSTVLKLQVGLLGTGWSLQRDLNRIAEVADTSNSEGLIFILRESIQALLRHPDYCISGYSSVDVKWNINEDEGKELFYQLSNEERGKFDEETLVNVNNIKKKSTVISQKASGLSNGYIVITILVAAKGVQKLPPIKRSDALKKALEMLASIPGSEIQAVEVLWTPQDESDTLSEEQMLQDYPLLSSLSTGNVC